jgi:hypothetical protein
VFVSIFVLVLSFASRWRSFSSPRVPNPPARAPAKGPSKVQARIPASQFQQGIVVLNYLPQFKKKRSERKPKENAEVVFT